MTIEFSAVTKLTLSSQLRAFPSVLLAKDLNGDGNLDLITDFSESSNGITRPATKAGVAVLYGIGGGQFTAKQKYAIGQVVPNPNYRPPGVPQPPFNFPFDTSSPTITLPLRVKEIETGDIDRDGILDLITLGTYGSELYLSVLKGNGTGFSEATNSPVIGIGNLASGLAVADFNGDSNLDVAAIPRGNGDNITRSFGQEVSILLGDGTGKFGSEKTIFLGIDTCGVVAADFNGDGRVDLAVGGVGKTTIDVDELGANVSILLSDGTGGFSLPNTISVNPPSGGFPFSLFTNDFNGDGKVDVGNGDWYLAGNGTGQFTPFYPFQVSNDFIATGDFNGDGKLDVVGYPAASNVQQGTSVLFGNGAGRYSIPVAFANDSFPEVIVAGDFNQDGKPDVAVLASETISVFLNRTTSTDVLAISGETIDASIKTGGLLLNLKKGTLKIGGVSKTLNGKYRFVQGTEQADQITGGKLGESVDGLAGNDVIVGGDGNDFCNGNLGNDILTGGKGKDTFAFLNGAIFVSASQYTSFDQAMGIDKITDFEVGTDKINLYRNTFTAFTSRRISFESVATLKEARKSKALIAYIPKTGSLFYNQNGTKGGFGSGGQFADVTNGLELQSKDLLLF